MKNFLIISALSLFSLNVFASESTTTYTDEDGRKYTIDCPTSKVGLINDINRYARKGDGFSVRHISMMKTGAITMEFHKVISEDETQYRTIDVPNFEGCLLIGERTYKK
jgi:hypothetical protein